MATPSKLNMYTTTGFQATNTALGLPTNSPFLEKRRMKKSNNPQKTVTNRTGRYITNTAAKNRNKTVQKRNKTVQIRNKP